MVKFALVAEPPFLQCRLRLMQEVKMAKFLVLERFGVRPNAYLLNVFDDR